MATDTSSSAAASTAVVGAAAVELAALSAQPRLAKSVAAESSTSGSTMTNDIQTSRQVRKSGVRLIITDAPGQVAGYQFRVNIFWVPPGFHCWPTNTHPPATLTAGPSQGHHQHHTDGNLLRGFHGLLDHIQNTATSR